MIWTVGHSTRPLQDFLDLLASHGVQAIADVRRFPGSRKHPQFGHDALSASLEGAGRSYLWLPALGGRRRPKPDSKNTVWRNASFRGYADYMETAEFAEGLDALLELCKEQRTTLMCAEAPWWRCHRALIADALCARGVEVVHILDERRTAPHRYQALISGNSSRSS